MKRSFGLGMTNGQQLEKIDPPHARPGKSRARRGAPIKAAKTKDKNMRRQPTPEQKAAAAERRAKFKALWKQVADLPQDQRIAMSHKYGFRTVEGHELSLFNQLLIALQCPTASVLGGFRQWLKHGRAVQKGQHGIMIWVPCGAGKAEPTTPDQEATEDGKPGFIVGTVFDIAQTQETNATQEAA